MKEKNKLDEKSKNNYRVGLYLILTFFALWYIKSLSKILLNSYGVIRPMVIGFAIAFVIDLPMSFFQEKVFSKFIDPLKHRNLVLALSLIISWIMFFAIIALILVVVIPELINAIESTIKNLPAFMDAIIKYTQKIPSINQAAVDFKENFGKLDLSTISQKITDYASGDSTSLLSRAQSIISSVS